MGSMANVKSLLLLLAVLTSGCWEQSCTSSGVQKLRKTPSGKPVVIHSKSMADTSSQLMEWERFKKQYKIHFTDKKTDDRYRNLFLQNLGFIKNRTRLMVFKKDSFKIAMNGKFWAEDFNTKIKTGCISGTSPHSTRPCPTKKLSLKNQALRVKDWRPHRVRSVKDQGSCSSCWAFSAVAVLEGWFASKNQNLLEFSPQQLLDCHNDDPYKSCSKSRKVQDAFGILNTLNGSIATSAAYPYKSKGNRKCHITSQHSTIDQNSIHMFTGKCSRVDTTAGQKEIQLKEAVVRYGPVSASIYTALRTFKFYKSGIYDDKECSEKYSPTHAVTVVGFGTEGNTGYWIIKNSWGTDWGEEGYMKLVMGKNLCGIANIGYFVTENDDIEGDIEPEKSDNGGKVGSGSRSLHRASVGIGVTFCLAILTSLVFSILFGCSY